MISRYRRECASSLHLRGRNCICTPTKLSKTRIGLSLPSLIYRSFRENGSHHLAVAGDALLDRVLAAERKVISNIARITIEIATSCSTGIQYEKLHKLLATGADDYTIQLWNSRTGQAARRLNEPDRRVRSPGVYPDGQRVYSLAFSPDGKTLASAGDLIKNNLLAGGQVTLWEIRSGKLLRTIIVNSEITTYTNSVVFTPDGKGLVTGMTRVKPGESAGKYVNKGEIGEWNAQTGALERKWKPLDAGIHSVTFSPNGRPPHKA
jgi:WD40 repeat protein